MFQEVKEIAVGTVGSGRRRLTAVLDLAVDSRPAGGWVDRIRLQGQRGGSGCAATEHATERSRWGHRARDVIRVTSQPGGRRCCISSETRVMRLLSEIFMLYTLNNETV